MVYSHTRSAVIAKDKVLADDKAAVKEKVLDLVLRARGNDQQAWAALYRLHQRLVISIVRRLVSNPNDMEEVVQETFLRAAKFLPQLERGEHFKSWLGTIARRTAINFLRLEVTRRKREFCRETEIVLSSAASREPHPTEELSRKEISVAVQVQIARLRRIDREILLAFYFDDLSINEIAAQFELKIGTVKRRLHIARLRSREMMASCDSTNC